MNATPLVSVIIPTYRRPHLLVRAINSVLNQTYKKLEVLVVDDHSQDETPSVVCAIKDPRVRYVGHDVNKGLPAVRNTGIRTAQGEYIAFLDDDDEWREDKIEKQLLNIKGYDAILCMGIWKGYPLRLHRRVEITCDDLRRGSFNPSSALIRTDVLRNVMFDESLRQGEDWDAFIRIAQRYSIAWLPDPLLLYNEGEHPRITNEGRNHSWSQLEKRLAILHKHREFFGEQWYKFHVVDSLLIYIGTRSDRLSCLANAIKRCGVMPVFAVLFARIYRLMERSVWKWRHPQADTAHRISGSRETGEAPS